MTHKLSILLVEDEKNICDFISTSLSAQDYRISTAHTGKKLFRSSRPSARI